MPPPQMAIVKGLLAGGLVEEEGVGVGREVMVGGGAEGCWLVLLGTWSSDGAIVRGENGR